MSDQTDRRRQAHLDHRLELRRCRRRRLRRRSLRQQLRAVRARPRRRRPVEVDISALKPGEKMTVEWRGKPVWIVRRTPEQLAELPKLDAAARRPEVASASRRAHARLRAQRGPLDQARVSWSSSASAPTSAARRATSSRPAPQPSLPDDWAGGFLCPCHGSTFDMAGRVFKNKPAPDNLEVPPHMYLSDSRLLIGEDKKA